MAGAGLALGIGLSLLPGDLSRAVAAPVLSEAEEMQRIVQERTGKQVPQITSAPSVSDGFSKPQKRLQPDQLSDFTRELQ